MHNRNQRQLDNSLDHAMKCGEQVTQAQTTLNSSYEHEQVSRMTSDENVLLSDMPGNLRFSLNDGSIFPKFIVDFQRIMRNLTIVLNRRSINFIRSFFPQVRTRATGHEINRAICQHYHQ